MSRRTHPITEAEAQRLQAQAHGARRPGMQRRDVVYGSSWGLARSQPTPEGWCLVFWGKLPSMNKEHPDWRQRWNLKQACLRQFGILPVPETRRAQVTMTRVLGPHERLMDDDNLIYALKGARDSLTTRRLKARGMGYTGGGNYIIDDSPHVSRFTYIQDASRRQEGPCIMITIRYEECHR